MNNICIIGCNYGSNVVLRSIRYLNNKNIKITGISGRKSRGKIFDGIDYYNNWKYMIKKNNPDLVIISVPPINQTLIMKYLLNKNIDFMFEKPLTTDRQKLKNLEKIYKKSKSKCFIDINFLTVPSVIKMKNIIKKNLSPNSKIELKWYINPRTSNKKIWKNDVKKGGGELNNFFFHVISILNFWFGKNYSLELKKKSNELYIISFKQKKITFNIRFAVNKYNNLFLFKLSNPKSTYYLINKSKDYHNYFKIYKDEKIFFDKNFKKNHSRILSTKEILKYYFSKNIKSDFMFKNSINIQNKIFDLQSV